MQRTARSLLRKWVAPLQPYLVKEPTHAGEREKKGDGQGRTSNGGQEGNNQGLSPALKVVVQRGSPTTPLMAQLISNMVTMLLLHCPPASWTGHNLQHLTVQFFLLFPSIGFTHAPGKVLSFPCFFPNGPCVYNDASTYAASISSPPSSSEPSAPWLWL